MSLIRQRRKNLYKACLLGIVMGVVVVGCFLTIWILFIFHKEDLTTSQSKYSKEQVQVYELNKTLAIGEIIKEEDLIVQTVSQESMPSYSLELEELLGRKTKCSLKAGTIVTEDLVSEKELMDNDMRLMKYEFVKLTEKLSVGDYIDVRISFANGADFILLSKKKIEDLVFFDAGVNTSNALWLKITEEELLRVSSAVVDAYLNEGCSIYAIEYLSVHQEEAMINYPENDLVKKLIAEDPNVITKAKNVLVSSLRSELKLQVNAEDVQQELDDSVEGTIPGEINAEQLYKNEEIEYLN